MRKKRMAALGAARIAEHIVRLRGHSVLLDTDLARLYGVQTRVLVQAVKRNDARFPADFMFQLSPEEVAGLRSQFVISNPDGRGGRRYAPYAFTEQGVAMLSSVLKSQRAIAINIKIMRAFVQLRGILSTNKDLARKLDAIERRVGDHDQAIAAILSAIRELMAPPETPKKRRMGFIHNDN